VTFAGVFTQGSNGGCWATGTSVGELASAGIALSYIVVLKLLFPADGGSGWVAASTLGSWVSQAQSQVCFNDTSSTYAYLSCLNLCILLVICLQLNWTGGIGAWQYSQASGASWLQVCI
jgi:hypothetical protein